MSFNAALEAGCEPRNYSWLTEDIPIGDYEVRLDFMIWSKKQVAVDCYFTTIDDDKQIRLTAYRNKSPDYMAGETTVRHLPFGSILLVTVGLNGAGNPRWVNAAVAGSKTPPD